MLNNFEQEQNNQLIYISESLDDPLLLQNQPVRQQDSPSLPISPKKLLDPTLSLHHPSITIEASNELYNGVLVWHVIFEGRHRGALLFDRDSSMVNPEDFTLLNPAYEQALLASYGSTNSPVKNTLTARASYPSQAVYESLEQSKESANQIGFL
jgi:hypothetical protein